MKSPQRLKPDSCFEAVSARLKACPDTDLSSELACLGECAPSPWRTRSRKTTVRAVFPGLTPWAKSYFARRAGCLLAKLFRAGGSTRSRRDRLKVARQFTGGESTGSGESAVGTAEVCPKGCFQPSLTDWILETAIPATEAAGYFQGVPAGTPECSYRTWKHDTLWAVRTPVPCATIACYIQTGRKRSQNHLERGKNKCARVPYPAVILC